SPHAPRSCCRKRRPRAGDRERLRPPCVPGSAPAQGSLSRGRTARPIAHGRPNARTSFRVFQNLYSVSGLLAKVSTSRPSLHPFTFAKARRATPITIRKSPMAGAVLVRSSRVVTACAALIAFGAHAQAASTVEGRVMDVNGRPVAGAQVIFDRDDGAPGASAVTVFSGDDGRFAIPGRYPEITPESVPLVVRSLDHEQVGVQWTVEDKGESRSLRATLIVRPRTNQADVAPASAWLARIGDRARQSKLIMDCIDCHQVPSSEVRNFARLIADQHAPNPRLAREQSWNAIVKYMNYLSRWEFSRGRRDPGEKIDTDAVYAVDNGAETAALLVDIFDDRLDSISGYSWGAPLIATRDTTIWEFEIPHPNAVREALLLGDPPK